MQNSPMVCCCPPSRRRSARRCRLQSTPSIDDCSRRWNFKNINFSISISQTLLPAGREHGRFPRRQTWMERRSPIYQPVLLVDPFISFLFFLLFFSFWPTWEKCWRNVAKNLCDLFDIMCFLGASFGQHAVRSFNMNFLRCYVYSAITRYALP